MAEHSRATRTWTLTWILLLSGSLLGIPLPSHGQQAKGAAVEGVSYNVNSSMGDNLKALSGKRVSIHLAGGKTLTGVVKEVSNNLVHLEKLEGREFFDALVSIGAIEAIDTRFRSS